MKINCMDANEYPIIEKENIKHRLTISANVFKEMVKRTIFATSKDENRKILQGVKFEIEDGYLKMIALDLYRIALIKEK